MSGGTGLSLDGDARLKTGQLSRTAGSPIPDS